MAPPGLEAPERVVRRVSRQKLQVPSSLKRQKLVLAGNGWGGGEEENYFRRPTGRKCVGDDVYRYLVGKQFSNLKHVILWSKMVE